LDQHERIVALLRNYLKEELTAAERAELAAWADHKPENRWLLKRIGQEDRLMDDMKAYWDLWNDEEATGREQRIGANFRDKAELAAQSRVPLKTRGLRRWLPYAAAALIVLAVGFWVVGNRWPMADDGTLAATEIRPGGNRATLTLADGRTVDLSEEQSGIVVGDGITYPDGTLVDASLRESVLESGKSAKQSHMLTLTTPKGGTYQVTLPDGSKVWLNAASTITYPSRFAGNERVVEISGEAFLSVTTDKSRPFSVKSNGQIVEVLGTAFNLSAYPDEPETKTTLVEGSVRVAPNTEHQQSITIRPGEQSVVRGVTAIVTQVDVERYTSWKSGYFYFKNTPFNEVMQQLARWYDIEVIYNGRIPQETFSGKMDRDLTLNAVLKLLNVSEIQAQIADNEKLIVY